LKPLAFFIDALLEPPSENDKKADRERLLDSISQAAGTDIPVDIDLDALRQLPSALRRSNYSLLVLLAYRAKSIEVIDLGERECYGIALDLGTTNLVASLFNLKTCKRIAVMDSINPQTSVASDVLSRIHESMRGRGSRLHRLIIDGVNELIEILCKANDIDKDSVYAISAAGNTIMTHYFMDLPVENIPVSPYIPTAHNFGLIRSDRAGLSINHKGSLYLFPNAGSYVGGDIVSGILISGLYKCKKPSLLIDVGTNVEIVLGCDEWIIVGAGAAGPALEGDIAGIGMKAVDGAIFSFIIVCDESGVSVQYETVGGSLPAGICGSGMIELVSELFNSGAIDQRGKFNDSSLWSGRIVNEADGKVFCIDQKEGSVLSIKETEIENFLRSKAALFASIHLLVKSVGLSFADLDTVYVGGAFGSHINVDKAVRIGMLPDIDRKKFKILGNSSLAGAEELLLHGRLISEVSKITSLITYREMNTEGDFLREFPAAMFLPHTNPEVLKA